VEDRERAGAPRFGGRAAGLLAVPGGSGGEPRTERSDEASAWRLSTRRAFEHYLGRGYRVDVFYRDPGEGRCFYGLEIS
jgi:predicted GNAT superfamily acetyltransferase